MHPDRVRRDGWDHFHVFALGASGPRAFATSGFDLVLLDLLRRPGALNKSGHKWFLAGSTGALRSCALVASSLLPPGSPCLTRELKEHFVGMRYQPGDTPETLAGLMSSLYHKVLPPELVDQVISHPRLHLCIVVAQILPPFASLPRWQLKALFWYFLGANFVSPRALDGFQRPLCFYTGPKEPPFLSQSDNVTCVPLTSDNIYQVLQATTCLPFMSPHVHHLPGIGPGLFFDGALCNYHLNVTSCKEHPVLLLGDGPGPEFKQTLWDAYVSYRFAPRHFRRHVSVLHPMRAFEASLPAGCMPHTFEYFKEEYVRDPELRRAHWRRCFDASVEHFPRHPAELLPSALGDAKKDSAAPGSSSFGATVSGDSALLPRTTSFVRQLHRGLLGLASGGGAAAMRRSTSDGGGSAFACMAAAGAADADCEPGSGFASSGRRRSRDCMAQDSQAGLRRAVSGLLRCCSVWSFARVSSAGGWGRVPGAKDHGGGCQWHGARGAPEPEPSPVRSGGPDQDASESVGSGAASFRQQPSWQQAAQAQQQHRQRVTSAPRLHTEGEGQEGEEQPLLPPLQPPPQQPPLQPPRRGAGAARSWDGRGGRLEV